MLLEERIRASETHQFRVIFNDTLNDKGNLFGGRAMLWMDEVAYITAIRFSHMKVVTVCVENVKFKKAILPGSLVEIIGNVIKVGSAKIEIQVEIFVESSESGQREKAIWATFFFAVVDANNKPISLGNYK